ncbi:MAG: KOW domain-containing RNA-binding protein [Clostridia bacterium]|jgi:ribosomal protein L14E/L6E/L27E|nr:KOW domain-containing RNA-binding protein [Clostridia bacterium]
MFERGMVVRSLAGRDSGYLLAVVRADENRVLVCDGKERPLDRPKIKNIRHVEPVNVILDEYDMRGNRALKKALACVKAEIDCND